MQLTSLQLKIQERAEKKLTFGCLFRSRNYVMRLVRTSEIVEKKKVTGRQTWYSYDRGEEVGGHREAVKYLGDFRHISGGICGGLREEEIVGHPMDWGRLSYLGDFAGLPGEPWFDTRVELIDHFDKDRERYIQTILEWDIETQELVLKFLLTLQKGLQYQ